MRKEDIVFTNQKSIDEFKNLCNLTTNLLGLPDNSLSSKSRKQYLHMGRAIAAVIGLTEDNTHSSVIASVLNRHRCSVYHYEKMHKNNYATWGVYRNTFNKIYLAYKNLPDTKKTFLDDDFLKQHLLKNGVAESVKSQVFLEIKSGEAICIIKTSYFEFSNQLENVKLAMEDYEYKIKII